MDGVLSAVEETPPRWNSLYNKKMFLNKLFQKKELSVKHVLALFSFIFVLWTVFRYLPEPPLWLTELVLKPLIWLGPTYWLVKKVEKESLASLGISQKNLFPALYWGIGLGLVFGLEGLLTHILKYRGLQLIDFETGFLKFAGLVLLSFVTAFSEEAVFRGYIFQRFWRLWKKEWLANVAAAFLFALIHLPIGVFVLGYQPVVMMAYLGFVFVFGVGSAFVLARSGNLIASILLHVFWSWPILLFR